MEMPGITYASTTEGTQVSAEFALLSSPAPSSVGSHSAAVHRSLIGQRNHFSVENHDFNEAGRIRTRSMTRKEATSMINHNPYTTSSLVYTVSSATSGGSIPVTTTMLPSQSSIVPPMSSQFLIPSPSPSVTGQSASYVPSSHLGFPQSSVGHVTSFGQQQHSVQPQMAPPQQSIPVQQPFSAQQSFQVPMGAPMPYIVQQRRFEFPPLEVPKFNGDEDSWNNFWNLFRVTVHDEMAMSNFEKFVRLQSLLTGPAQKMAEGLVPSNENYSLLVQRLQTRFDRPDKRKSIIISKILHLSSMSLNPIVKAREWLDTVVSYKRELDVLGFHQVEYIGIMGPVILDRLDAGIRSRWVRNHGPDITSMDELLHFIETEIRIGEQVAVRMQPMRPQSSSTSSSGLSPSTALSLPAISPSTTPPAVEKKAKSCVVPGCKQSHRLLIECPKFRTMNPRQRSEFVRGDKRCINCLSPKHDNNKESCLKRSCLQCGGKHHRFLCFRESSERQDDFSQGQISSSNLNRSNSSTRSTGQVATFSPSVVAVIPSTPTLFDTDPNVFVKIIQLQVSHGDRCFKIHGYLDDGSKRTYIHSKLAEALGLSPVTSKPLCTGVFMGQIHSQVCHGVNLMVAPVHDPSNTRPLCAWTTPSICPPVKQEFAPDIPERYSWLSPWADDLDGGVREFSILIGADQIGQFEYKTYSTTSPLKIVSTFFGHVPFGPHGSSASSSQRSTQSITLLATDCDPSLAVHADRLDNLWVLDTVGVENPEEDRFPKPRYNGERYSVRLPFKGVTRPLPNLALSLKREASVVRRLTPSQLKQYDDKINEWFADEIIEHASTPDHVGTFIPHHPVWQKKLRIVHDGSAPDPRGICINACLDPGPNLLSPLLDVLMRSRRFSSLLVSDVKAAFLQVAVDEEDRKWLKFSWKSQRYQFARVCFGLSCSPFLLHTTVLNHIKNSCDPELVDQLIGSIYVDDVLLSAPSDSEVKSLQSSTIDVFSKAGMVLKPDPDCEKLLGVGWDQDSDHLYVISKQLVPNETFLVRSKFLSIVASVHDPIGILSPWVIVAKLILQEACSSRWSDPLPDHLTSRAIRWLTDITRISEFQIPRCMFCDTPFQLHCFTDASERAYGYVVYVVRPNLDPVFVAAKARCAPLNPKLSIPRLELMAFLLGMRFLCRLIPMLNPVASHIWTDSQCVVNWVKSGSPSKRDIFVSNRLSEITKIWPGNCSLHHIAGEDNPADCISRGLSFDDLLASRLYRYGPQFLPFQCNSASLVSLDSESKDDSTASSLPAPRNCRSVGGYCPILNAVNPSNFKSFASMCRTTAYVIRFITGNFSRQPLSRSEIQVSQFFILRHAQESAFASEFESLEKNEPVLRSSCLKLLNPCLIDGIIHFNPRIPGALPVPIVPKGSPLIPLMIRDHHLLHQGATATLSSLRSAFWVLGARSEVKRFVHDCINCRRFYGLPYSQHEGFLADFRSQVVPVWSHTGIDMFGPLNIKSSSGVSKAWGLLFTCATVRSIHLEVLHDGSARSVHDAIRKFLSIRVKIHSHVQFFSDNAKVFVKVSSMRFVNHTTSWDFIPSRSPTWGGWWERLIALVKRSLRVCLHRSILDFRALECFMIETSAVINSRPITKVADSDRALCPADFLHPLPCESHDTPLVSSGNLTKMFKFSDMASKMFWKRFVTEYFSSLSTWSKPRRKTALLQPAIDDLVLVRDNCPRGSWPLGLITKTFKSSRDDIIRSVEVRVRGKLLTRTVTQLYPLEAARQ